MVVCGRARPLSSLVWMDQSSLRSEGCSSLHPWKSSEWRSHAQLYLIRHICYVAKELVSLDHILYFSSLCVQNQYEKHKEVSTAQGVKILGKDLEKTLAGLPLLVAHKEDEIPVLRVTIFLYKPISCVPLSISLRTHCTFLSFLSFLTPALIKSAITVNLIATLVSFPAFWYLLFVGRVDPGAETDSECHKAGGEGCVCAGLHARLSGGSTGVLAYIQSACKSSNTSHTLVKPFLQIGYWRT